MNIYLIGYRGTGKTSVGKSLASILNWPFIDADLELVARVGMAIDEFVRKKGWKTFRNKERTVMQQICKYDMRVVATGGGVVLDSQNIKSMQNSGTLVWLKALPETIRARLLCDQRSGQSRPALTSKGLTDEIEEMLIQRDPYYKTAMDFCIETDLFNIDEICNVIVAQLTECGVQFPKAAAAGRTAAAETEKKA